MPGRGFEPPLSYENMALNHARLPIPPPGRACLGQPNPASMTGRPVPSHRLSPTHAHCKPRAR